jgi:hypothetical protein
VLPSLHVRRTARFPSGGCVVTSARADKTLYRPEPEPDRHEALHHAAGWVVIHSTRVIAVLILVAVLVVSRI